MSAFATVKALKAEVPLPALDERAIIQRLRAACVAVRVPGGSGTGFLLDERGFIVTNQHVVGCSPVALLELSDRTRSIAKVLRSSRRLDLALLLLPEGFPALPTLALSRREPEYGERVLAFGNPLSLDATLTQGVVSHPGREVRGATYVQTDAAVNSGNSGGPLVDSEGAVVGVNSFGARDATNLNFALAARHVWDWMPILEVHLPRLRAARYCNVCGFTNVEPDPNCLRCGARTRDLVIPPALARLQEEPPAPTAGVAERQFLECGVCRHTVTSDQRFCRRCGATLEEGTR